MFSTSSLLVMCLGLTAITVNRAAENSATETLELLRQLLLRADQGVLEEPAGTGEVKVTDNNSARDNGGAVFVRWGRNVCPDTDTELVYSGVAGGNHQTNTGGGADLICLTRAPEYQNYTTTLMKHGALYGAEYEAPNNIFSHRNAPVNKVNGLDDHDVPCAVCRANTRISKIMIPGRKSCHGSGWTREYWGYLATEYWGHVSQMTYVCVDEAPEGDTNGAANHNGALLYVAQGICGSLPCPPYNNYWELTCVVCTK